MTIATEQELKPGVYPNVSWADYAAIPLPSASTIEWARISPLHLKAALEGRLEREDSNAMAFGRALHLRLLEPDIYQQRVIVAKPCGVVLSTGKNKGQLCCKSGIWHYDSTQGGEEWRCGMHGGEVMDRPEDVEVISEVEAANIERCADALRNHPGERLRRSRGEFEVAMIADICGVRVKARMDKWIPEPAAIIDVKKVAAATSPHRSTGTVDGFDKLIASLGYGFRAALYTDIAKAVTGKDHRWFWVVVEDGEPFSVGVFEAANEVIEAGRREYTKFLNDVKTIRAGGECFGFSRSVEMLYGPDWWRKQTGGIE